MDGSSGLPLDVAAMENNDEPVRPSPVEEVDPATTATAVSSAQTTEAALSSSGDAVAADNTSSGSSNASKASLSASAYQTLQPELTEFLGLGSAMRTAGPASSSFSSLASSSTPASASSSPSSSSAPQPQPGCGCVAASNVPESDEITISITPTTGGQFELTVDKTDTVENLKKIISKKLKVAKERICLLHREKQLREGTLEENRLQDGSRLTLLPSVETGLLAQRPEQSVMQALESLNDSQVNDFLSGKAPLNLTMRLGDHMMLIQLQLSTVTPASPTVNQASNSTSGLTIGDNTSISSNLPSSHVSTSLQGRRSTVLAARSTSSSSSSKLQNGNANARTASMISSLVSALHATANCSTSLSTATTTTSPVCSSRATTASSVSSSSYSPIGSSHTSFCSGQSQQPNRNPASPTGGNPSAACQSCLLYHHNHHYHNHHSRNKPSSPSLTSTTNTPSSVGDHLQQSPSVEPPSYDATTTTLPRKKFCMAHYHHRFHHSRNKSSSPNPSTQHSSSTSPNGTTDHLQQSTSTEQPPYEANSPPRKKLCTAHHQQANADAVRNSSAAETDVSPQNSPMLEQTSKAATLDTRALAEASRNLTQKLKQLSSEVLTSRVDLAEENARRRQGAIIESMHHHGKGVYSGTFSGTLNPALQDRHGRPKRDISTIIHILNDLLCATPAATAGHYRHHHRHSSGRQQSSVSTSSTGTTMTTNGSATPVGCHDTTASGYSTEELSKENEATKWKMRRLRLVMEQRRALRKARRQARAAPYTTQWAAVTPDPDPNHDPNTSSSSPSASGTANTAEPQNEPELQPCSPEPVVA